MEIALHLLRDSITEGSVQMRISEGTMLPLTSRLPREARMTPPGPISICKTRILAMLQVPLSLKCSVTNLHEGGFRKLIFKLIEWCGFIAWRIKLLFITIHFLSLA